MTRGSLIAVPFFSSPHFPTLLPPAFAQFWMENCKIVCVFPNSSLLLADPVACICNAVRGLVGWFHSRFKGRLCIWGLFSGYFWISSTQFDTFPKIHHNWLGQKQQHQVSILSFSPSSNFVFHIKSSTSCLNWCGPISLPENNLVGWIPVRYSPNHPNRPHPQ